MYSEKSTDHSHSRLRVQRSRQHPTAPREKVCHWLYAAKPLKVQAGVVNKSL